MAEKTTKKTSAKASSAKKTVSQKKTAVKKSSQKTTAHKTASQTTAKKAPAAKKSTPKSTTLYVIETGGKQYRVSQGETIKIEKLIDAKEGDKVVFDKVLLIDDGKDTKIGNPYLKGEKIEGTLVEEGRGKKISVIHFKNKIRYRKKYGHRQPYVKVEIK